MVKNHSDDLKKIFNQELVEEALKFARAKEIGLVDVFEDGAVEYMERHATNKPCADERASTNLVQKLVRGSENIDRMRKEVEMLCKMILSLVLPRDMSRHPANKLVNDHVRFVFEFMHENIIWNISDQFGRLALECQEKMPQGALLSVYCSGINRPIQLEHVKAVHESLPMLLEGLQRVFTTSQLGWDVLLMAADYEF